MHIDINKEHDHMNEHKLANTTLYCATGYRRKQQGVREHRIQGINANKTRYYCQG